MVISDNNISAFKTAIQISSGLVDGNYIHDPGYIAGDHTNGIYTNGGTEPLTIENNTIFDGLNQTDAINLDAGSTGVPVANKTVEGNFLAGGAYTVYGGTAPSNTTSNIVIKNNRFGQQYHPASGQYGPIAYFNPTSLGQQLVRQHLGHHRADHSRPVTCRRGPRIGPRTMEREAPGSRRCPAPCRSRVLVTSPEV